MFILLPLFVFPSVCFRFHLAAIFDWPATVDKPGEVLTEPDSQGDRTPPPPTPHPDAGDTLSCLLNCYLH